MNAIKAYKKDYDMGKADTVGEEASRTEPESAPEKETEARKEVSARENVIYGTQILASGREMSPSDKFFKGYKITAVKSGKLWKYVAGTSTDKAEAKEKNKKVKAAFPESFMVKVENGEVTRINL